MAAKDSLTSEPSANGSILSAVESAVKTTEELAPLVAGVLEPMVAGDQTEYELETPFGKVDVELEPSAKDDEKKRRKRERDEARALERARKNEAKQERAGAAIAASAGRSRGGRIVPLLIALLIVGALIAVAWWLFARPPVDDDLNAVPDDFRSPESDSASEPPQGLVASMRQRVRKAIRAGQRASLEEQAEQERRVRELTGQS